MPKLKEVPRISIIEERKQAKIRQAELMELRRAALAKGRIAQAEKRRQAKERSLAIAKAVLDDSTEKLVEIIDSRILHHSSQTIKAAFFQAFEDSGGKAELVKWIKSKSKHRTEFYRMLTTLIRQHDEDRNVASNKIVVNIFGLDQNNNEIVISENTLQIANGPVIDVGNSPAESEEVEVV